MKILVAIVSFMFISVSAQSADVLCSCRAEDKCSDVKINFIPSNPGVYMTIEYAYGERNLEGFATLTRDSKEKKTIYRLGNFTLVEKDGKFELPFKKAVCL